MSEEKRSSNGVSMSFFVIVIILFVVAGAIVIMAGYGYKRLSKSIEVIEASQAALNSEEKTVVVEEPVKEEAPKLSAEELEIRKIAYCIQSLQPRHSFETSLIIAKHTYTECNERGISIPLWIALMFTESSLDPMKASSAGALGLSQVRYSVWKEQPELVENGVESKYKLFWVDLNIKAGASILKKYYDESGGKIGVALWRYNSGQSRLPEGKSAYDIGYVNKIMFYAYKVDEMMKKTEIVDHPIFDADAQADREAAQKVGN